MKIIFQGGVEFRLDRQAVHNESIRCVKKVAAMTDSQTGRILGRPAELELLFDELFDFGG
jgi:hypothetical protein